MKIAVFISGGVVLGLAFVLLTPVEQFRLDSPDGAHTAIVSSRRLFNYLPAWPGQGGDRPGFATLVDGRGNRLGRIPLQMIQHGREIRWETSGAEIPLVGGWSFTEHTYWYWNNEQTQRITKELKYLSH